MFSELCRETLRKAAVCYNSGRSASPSPSPPNSPPSSPAKEPKTVSSSINHTSQNHTSSRHHSSDNKDKKYTTIVTAPTSSSSHSSFKEKRHATPTVFSGRRSPGGIDHRDLRRSPERGGRHEVLSARGYSQSLETSPEPMDESSTSEDEAGAAPEEGNQRSSSSSHNRHSITKDVKRRSLYDEDSLDGDHPYDLQGRESVGSAKDTDRVKLVRDRQNEERQRKLEELRQQALAAQRFREQREEERRKRIDELRSRDNDRRNQVEERKRLIWEAERERREAILRKNQEREARIEAKKKNERSHIVFAFGSSTPRMLEPADTGGSTFWGTRRATSTTNVMMFTAAQPLTRRSSERELDGSKKRATSAGGLDRKPGEDMRMSSSMYEVFNWNAKSNYDDDRNNLTPLNNVKTIKRASLSLPPTTNQHVLDIDYKNDIQAKEQHRDYRSSVVNKRQTICGEDSDGTPGTPSSSYLRVNRRRTDLMPTIPSPREVSIGSGNMSSSSLTTGGRSSSSSSAKAFTRSPGRTYSMSRLDQLSQPRKRTGDIIQSHHLSTLDEKQQQQQQQQHHNQRSDSSQSSSQDNNKNPNLLAASSNISRSMSHLAQNNNNNNNNHGHKNNLLKRCDNYRSMGNLQSPILISRPTRAERLRRRARDQQQQQQQQQGIRSGEVTPSSPSRPHSSLSQQSGSSSVGSSNVSLRPRTTTTPRRPRPASIAGTGVTVTERHNFIGDLKITKDSKPPLPKVHHSTPKKPKDTTQDRKNITNDNVVAKKPVLDKLIKSSSSSSSNKASPRITPKATPIQSPASEINPEFIQNHAAAAAADDNNDNDVVESNENRDVYKNDKGINDKFDEKIDRGTEKNDAQQESRPAEPSLVISQEITSNKLIESESELKSKQELPPVVAQDSPSSKVQDNAQSNTTKELQSAQITQPIVEQVVQPALIKNEKKESAEKKNEKKLFEPEPKQENDGEEAVDMSASMIAKIRITTEEEAKAALAERRRIAREQAEREAELERQRIEEEERLEMERQRAEEEEQRRLEEETLRLASEARQAEEQRLRLAIEEAQRREEEDRKRREEEAKQKLEKEEAERKAREEAEKQRIEMAERLKKEEEERIARRKRVEAIMLRTRGKNQPNTPTKGEGGDGDKLKEESPGDENKTLSVSDKVGDVMTSSLIAEATEQFISSEQQALNIEHSNSTPSQPATITTATPTLAPQSNVVLRNGTTHSNGVNGGSNKILLIDNNDAQGNKDDVVGGGVGAGELKSHNNHTPPLATTNATTTTTTTAAATTTNTTSGNLRGNNGINNSLITEPLIVLDNATVKQNNVTNNLLDLSTSDFEMSSLGDQILDINTPKLANEDSINSNLNPTLIDTTTTTATTTFNPLANSFVQNSMITANVNENNTTTNNPFNMQDNHQVTDLLS